MRSKLLLIVLPTLCAATAAQPAFTSPRGFLSTEANTANTQWLGYETDANRSTQHATIDNTQVGQPRAGIRAVHWRRDASLPTNSAYVSRSVTVEMRMGHGDYSKVVRGRFSNLSTVLLGQWTTTYTAKPTNLPNWTNMPVSTPAAWTMRLPMDTPFTYNGTDALLYNWRGAGSTAPDQSEHPVDEEYNSANSYSPGADVGNAGCTTANGEMRLASYWLVYGAIQATTLRIDVNGGPASVPVTLFLGLTDPQITLPGLCTALRSSAELVLSIGSSDPGGSLGTSFDIPHDSSYIGGGQLYAQAWALDASQGAFPVAGSRAQQLGAYPSPPTPGLQVARSVIGVSIAPFVDTCGWDGYGAIVTGFEN